jgi:hypothetical protein
MRFQIRPKLRFHLTPVLAAVALCAAITTASADELTTPPAQGVNQSASQANVPARGMSMEKVEASYGTPSTRAPAVGEPPITRWEYPGFVVYFEHQLVIHAVAIG